MSTSSFPRLTEQTKAGGCASKLSPAVLDRVLSRLPRQTYPEVLVGFETSDDAGVFRLRDDLAIVQTVDFFTPMVDDPFTFGQIAATNALSDIYAMGGQPVSALAVVAFPETEDPEVLRSILEGGLSKMTEAACAVIGGHSVRDPEIKFGYAVTGTVHPDRILRNKGARPGDVLLLTKPLGTGVITTALKRGIAEPEWVAAATGSMTTLNRSASGAITGNGLRVHALTDVTGFGLVGHAREMALASDVTFSLASASLPVLPGVRECIAKGAVPAGLLNNLDFAGCVVDAGDSLPEELWKLVFDPQTAGGLLISVHPEDADRLEGLLAGTPTPACRVGRVQVRGDSKPILLR